MTSERSESLSGGCIARVERVHLSTGGTCVRKTYPERLRGIAEAEAAGLRELAAGDGPPVPRLLSVQGRTLTMQDLGEGRADADAWDAFARALAAQHQRRGRAFGFAVTTHCGRTAQPNAWLDDGHAFVALRRLGHLASACREAGAIDAAAAALVERICERLPQLVPLQPPVLLHGDLWSGNVHPAADGRLHLIDPACWYGWAECDVAMTRLFGGFPERFYAAYLEAHPLPAGWERRCELHNLYHILNHALLFGGGYGAQAAAMARRWA